MNESELVKERQTKAIKLFKHGATKKYVAIEIGMSLRTIQRYTKNAKSID